MPAAHHCDWSLGGTQHTNVLVLWRHIYESPPVGFCFVPFIGRNDKPGQPTEWWITCALTLLDLIFVERLTVAGYQRLHDWVLGLMRLQVADTTAFLAARTPNHLMQ